MLIAAWGLSIYFYAHFPDRVASHWNFAGEVDGYMGKSFAFSIPGLITSMYLLFLFLPQLDPKKERYAEFSGVYNFFRFGLIFVLLAVYVASGLYNLGYNVKINLVVPWLIGLLFIFMGNYMGKIKSNWFMGVRTPWTLSSENVWNKSNRFGGFSMVLFGVLLIATPYLPKTLAYVVFIFGLLLMTLGTFAYSYWAYKEEEAEKRNLIVK